MRKQTFESFFDELSSIKKEAGLKDVAKSSVQEAKKLPQIPNRLKNEATLKAVKLHQKHPGLFEAAHDPENWAAISRGLERIFGG